MGTEPYLAYKFFRVPALAAAMRAPADPAPAALAGDRERMDAALADAGIALVPWSLEVLRDAGVLGDVAGVRQAVLGRPSGDAYHELVGAYLAGDGDTVLSLARHAELRSPANDLGRALAAEVCAAAGDPERAEAWLDRIAGGGPCPGVIAWARCGRRHRSDRCAETGSAGWADYLLLLAAGEFAGLDRLLGRLCGYAAVRSGTGPTWPSPKPRSPS